MQIIPLVLISISSFIYSQNRTTAPLPELKASIILRIIELERNISELDRGLTIYVLSAPNLAKALKKLEGKSVGETTLAEVSSGDELPAARPDVLFVGTSRKLNEVKAYTRKNRVLSITDRADVFQRGVSVSILTENRRPKISLNPSASMEEGLEWQLDFRLFRSLVLEFSKMD